MIECVCVFTTLSLSLNLSLAVIDLSVAVDGFDTVPSMPAVFQHGYVTAYGSIFLGLNGFFGKVVIGGAAYSAF